ncbi:MAG: hypothetical protein K0U38_00040 [Epsilonproteobacteria bacterium]|nr:hypothetical protein [Campylobacterota bacterium]
MGNWLIKYFGQPQGVVPTGIIVLLFFPLVLFAEFDTRIENSNFSISQDDTLYNYNRLRLQSNYSHENFFATFIGDGVNYYGKEYIDSSTFNFLKAQQSDTPFRTQTDFKNYGNGASYAKLYRLYGGYEDEKNRVVIGVQNIAMGVGRIWTPTNIFNPKNSYALEPDETFGVAALSYTRHLDDMSQIMVVSSQKEDNSFKSALRYKTFLEVADVALNIISSDDTTMVGYEVEGNLGDTGVEVRSEGAYIKHEFKNMKTTEFTQMIVGADYGFKNGVTLVGEMLYSSDTFSYNKLLANQQSDIISNMVNSNLYTALGLSKSFNIFLDGSLSYISSLNENHAHFLSSNLTYTLDDYNTFSVGALLYRGDIFNGLGDSYYFRYGLSF